MKNFDHEIALDLHIPLGNVMKLIERNFFKLTLIMAAFQKRLPNHDAARFSWTP